MANVKGNISDDLQEFIPNVCTNSPTSGSAFCVEHCKIISDMGYPTGLREFLKCCADVSNNGEINPDKYTKEMQKKVDTVLQQICNNAPSAAKTMS